jgi:hypothetical protein
VSGALLLAAPLLSQNSSARASALLGAVELRGEEYPPLALRSFVREAARSLG